jgi:hypothetical protein
MAAAGTAVQYAGKDYCWLNGSAVSTGHDIRWWCCLDKISFVIELIPRYPLPLSCPHLIKLLSLTDCFICRSLMQLRYDILGELSRNGPN